MSEDGGWEEVSAAKQGHIFYDAIDDGVRVLVMRGPFHLCAYLGVPKNHPLADFGYDDLPLSVHGGLTFGSTGDGKWPEGWFWYGWDYGHSGDFVTYYEKESSLRYNESHNKKWTVSEVVAEAKDACWDFRRLMKLAEKCSLKDSGFLIAAKQS